MPSTLLRIAVALLTFGFGVTATTLWIAYRTPDFKKLEAVSHHAPPMPLPPLPTVEEPPPPPAPLDEPPPLPGNVRAPILGGILDGKAISKPQPVFPRIARAAHVSGMVYVRITVDESGRVISANAISGHPMLRQAAVEAAYEARFAPTRLEGQPVKVSGTISYHFARQ
jgi:TonB family protein